MREIERLQRENTELRKMLTHAWRLGVQNIIPVQQRLDQWFTAIDAAKTEVKS